MLLNEIRNKLIKVPNPLVKFVFADINCSLAAHLSDGTWKLSLYPFICLDWTGQD